MSDTTAIPSKTRIKSESKIAPQAIPITAKEITAAGIALESIPSAQAASDASNVKFCEPSNRPHKESLEESIDKILRKKDAHYEHQTSNLVIERSAPNFFGESKGKGNHKAVKSTRGLVDPAGMSTYLASFFTLMTMASALAMAACSVCLVFDREQKLFLIGPAAALLLGIIYLIFCQKKRCCVCHQRLFTKARNLKKARAHHFPFLGYILPTCLHMIFKGWFRCMVCGSSIALFGKKR